MSPSFHGPDRPSRDWFPVDGNGFCHSIAAVAIAVTLLSFALPPAHGDVTLPSSQANAPSEQDNSAARDRRGEGKEGQNGEAIASDGVGIQRDSEPAEKVPDSAERLSQAIRRAIQPMESSVREYREQRQCFSCHHQAVPVMALDLARRRKFAVDTENLREQVEHTRLHLERGKADYVAGKGQGGRADTAGWALWTLEVAGHAPDEITMPVARYLLEWQRELGHWSPPSQRPPTEASPFTTTYVALRGISYFLPEERHHEREMRIAAVKTWLHEARPVDTEDHVFRLRGLYYLRGDEDPIADARQQLMELQRENGGWAQTSEMESDAYATATALMSLAEAGGVSTQDAVYQRGVKFLLDRQLADGTWHVETRSKPVQVYFESGFPHGKDQFISMAATAWATYALLLVHEHHQP